MEQQLANVFNTEDLTVRLDPTLDISFDTETSNFEQNENGDDTLRDATLTETDIHSGETVSDGTGPVRLPSIIKTTTAPKPKARVSTAQEFIFWSTILTYIAMRQR